MNPAELDVLVVGAGPAGLALALQAGDHGARVMVVERRAERFRPSRALVVHPRTLEVLRPLGVTGALLERGDAAPRVGVHLGRREVRVALGGFELPDTPFPYILFERQAEVESVLAGALAARGIRVERGCELVGLRAGRDGATAVVSRDGRSEQLDCQFVAGCDGPASTVRRLTGTGWPGGRYRSEVVLADVDLSGDLAPGTAHVVTARRGVVFLFAAGEQARWRMLATRPAHGAPGGAREVPPRELQDLLDGAGVAARITRSAWSARIPLEYRLAARYREGPAFLVGDAAHVHSPAGGQGMNTGVQDAANLGWKLALAAATGCARPAAQALLDSYEGERRPAARRALALTHLMFWAEAGPGPAASFLRGTVAPLAAPLLPAVAARRRLVARGVRVLSQLDVNYRTSPLSVEGSPPARAGPRPGDRLPDASVECAGSAVRLHDLLASPGAHLITAPGALAGVDAGPMVRVHGVTGWAGPAVVGVRPDGHVGLRSRAGGGGDIARWLGLMCLAPAQGLKAVPSNM